MKSSGIVKSIWLDKTNDYNKPKPSFSTDMKEDLTQFNAQVSRSLIVSTSLKNPLKTIIFEGRS